MFLPLQYLTGYDEEVTLPLYAYFLADRTAARHLWQHGQFGRGHLSRSKPVHLLGESDIGYKQRQYAQRETSSASPVSKEVLLLDPLEVAYLTWTLDATIPATVPLPLRDGLYPFYHHFRGKGHVPKSGLLFAADFVLYPLQRSSLQRHRHGGHIVTVVREGEALPSWLTMMSMVRVATNAKKQWLLSCARTQPLAGDCAVETFSISRWDPDRARMT